MHCIQGSDAHRLTRDPRDPKSLGVEDRVTEDGIHGEWTRLVGLDEQSDGE